jgi:uncharacterized small protein (DUF1192 family)
MSHGNQENALAATVNQNVAQVMELQQKIEILAAEIALFKALRRKRTIRAGK